MDNKDFDLVGSIKVRSANEDDATHLQTYCFPEKTQQEVADDLNADLAADYITRLVADSSGYAVGHITVKQHPLDDTVGQISHLAVSGPFRLLGVADHLIEAAEAAATDMGLTTLEIELVPSEKPVIQRYKDWGFSEKPIVILHKTLNAEVAEVEEATEEDNESEEVDATSVEQPQLLESAAS
ncbi:MAG: GNAT family N-acetyltransferase [Candidatus Poribacteria bacterium]|nr:GNAT family N-acetyltransferase [Candidatus Poribacteria bacterium]